MSPKEPQTEWQKRRIHADETPICTITIEGDPRTQSYTRAPEAQKNRMDAGAFAVGRKRLHNFRVTRLCTGCTRLMSKQLQMHVFR